MVDGVELWVSAWVKRAEGKKPFLSLAVKPKEEKPKAAKPSDPLADLPF
jgi:hypothetical protein